MHTPEMVEVAAQNTTNANVEYNDFQLCLKLMFFLFDVVKQSANRSDNNFATGAQVGSLFVHIDAAEEDGMAQRKIF